MKKVVLIAVLFLAVGAKAQDMGKVMESRAREMVRVIGLDDKEAWKKFIRENYTKTFIAKPMQSKKQTSGDTGSSSTASSEEGNVEGKAKMYQMLHNDFGGGKVSTLNISAETLKMTVTGSSGMTGTFSLKFSKEAPWLIDGLGIEVGN